MKRNDESSNASAGELDRRIDAALRRSYAPSHDECDAVAERLLTRNEIAPLAHAPGGGAHAGWRWPAGVAPAGVAVAAAAMVLVWFFVAPALRSHPIGDPVENSASVANDCAEPGLLGLWVDAYHEAVGAGFDVPSCCDVGNSDLSGHCREAFQAAVDIADNSALDLRGSYCGSAGGAVALLARYEGKPVCLFVVPQAQAPIIPPTMERDTFVFRRDVGVLAVFEVSHDSVARVLPHVFLPEG